MKCFHVSDSKGNGGMSYDNFLLFMMDTPETEDIVTIHSMMQKEVYKKLKLRVKDFERMFSTFRTAQNGFCRNSEFEKVCRKLFPKLSPNDLELITFRFDKGGDGIIDFSLFARWLYVGMEPIQVRNSLYISVD
jgi:Ca2+-binding EF-hand superfamily protein